MKKKPTLCPTCKNRHPIHDDGFEYFDCWNYLIKKKSRKEPTVEIWDKGRKEWVTILVK